MLEDLHIGIPVIGSDGHHIGTLERIVVEREEQRVTHIVVDPGLRESGNLLAPGGWEKPRARVIPISAITQVGTASIQLSLDQQAFAEEPLFEHEYYANADPQTGELQAPGERPRFRVGELIHYIATAAGIGAAPYEPTTEIGFRESGGSAEIAAGTPVWRREPHEEIGVVERVLINAATGRISALVLHRKGWGGKMVQLPFEAVSDVEDGIVHVALSEDELARLRPYQPEGRTE
ncbi:MAG: PRC-barrel domain-containing protein [Ktedonobacterales bacterium]